MASEISITDETVVRLMSCTLSCVDVRHPVTSVVPGVQGRLLAVLVETTSELNLRTLARLADVSLAQASRVMTELVALGMVERRDVPPSALFTLVREHIAVEAIEILADGRRRLLGRIADVVGAAIDVQPISVVVFGSLARGDAGDDSDIDLLIVRPDERSDDDQTWGSAVEAWRAAIRRASGNPVEVLEVSAAELSERLAAPSELWRRIVDDGVLVFGEPLAEIGAAV